MEANLPILSYNNEKRSHRTKEFKRYITTKRLLLQKYFNSLKRIPDQKSKQRNCLKKSVSVSDDNQMIPLEIAEMFVLKMKSHILSIIQSTDRKFNKIL